VVVARVSGSKSFSVKTGNINGGSGAIAGQTGRASGISARLISRKVSIGGRITHDGQVCVPAEKHEAQPGAGRRILVPKLVRPMRPKPAETAQFHWVKPAPAGADSRKPPCIQAWRCNQRKDPENPADQQYSILQGKGEPKLKGLFGPDCREALYPACNCDQSPPLTVL
jgi:hypothetical protein